MNNQRGSVIFFVVLLLFVTMVLMPSLSQDVLFFFNTINKKIEANDEFYKLENVALQLIAQRSDNCTVSGDNSDSIYDLIIKNYWCEYVSRADKFYYLFEDLGLINEFWHQKINVRFNDALLTMRMICPQSSFFNNNCISRSIISEQFVKPKIR